MRYPLAWIHSVMAGLVPAIHVFLAAAQTWMPAIRAFTPVFDGLWASMTEHVGQVEREPR